MIRKSLFLASSSEFSDDRKEFEIFVSRKSNDWVSKGVLLKLVVWEDFLDAVSQTRLQDEYNTAIRECDIFVVLFSTKVGRYTEEEFETAFSQFKATNKPFIFTYFKDVEVSSGSASKKDLMSLWAFQEKLDNLGHFYTRYKSIDELKFHFNRQLDKLAANGFIELKVDKDQTTAPGGTSYHAILKGDGAIAQGEGARAVGAHGVVVGGNNTGNINTGTQTTTDTGGGDFTGRDKSTQGISPSDLEPLFAPLLAAVVQHAPADQQAAAIQQVQELKAEAAKEKQADDDKVGRILDGLVALVPGAVGAVTSMFAAPILRGIAGPVTRFVLDKLKSD